MPRERENALLGNTQESPFVAPQAAVFETRRQRISKRRTPRSSATSFVHLSEMTYNFTPNRP